MSTHLIVLSKSYPMNTNMKGFRWFSKIFAIIVLQRKVASALEGLNKALGRFFSNTLSIFNIESSEREGMRSQLQCLRPLSH